MPGVNWIFLGLIVISVVTAAFTGTMPKVTEASLSTALAVSRTPVREALLRLQAEGVLRSSLARGFTVRPLDAAEAAELYPILGALESLAVAGIQRPARSELTELGRQLTELRRTTDPVRRWQLDTGWHQSLVALAANQRLTAMTGQLRTNLSRYELTFMREVPVRTEIDRLHRHILATLAAGDSTRAAEMLREHWQEGLRLVLAWLG